MCNSSRLFEVAPLDLECFSEQCTCSPKSLELGQFGITCSLTASTRSPGGFLYSHCNSLQHSWNAREVSRFQDLRILHQSKWITAKISNTTTNEECADFVDSFILKTSINLEHAMKGREGRRTNVAQWEIGDHGSFGELTA